MTEARDSPARKPPAAGLNEDLRKLMASPGAQPPTLAQRIGLSPVAAFIPWAIYWLVTNSPAGWFYAAVTALAVALIFAAPTIRSGLKVFDAVTIVFFAGMVVAGVLLGARYAGAMDVHSTVIAAAALALLAFVSLLFTPITAEYAREYVSPEQWGEPVFIRINRVVTFMWGSVFAAIAVLELIADNNPPARDWANWVLPIALFAFAVRFTQLYPARAIERAQRT
ncbi:MAG: hypothetical protein K0U69_10425 [Actinomycetia bacterium]|nr:hypothetical protein [Actinomycetes bacterium]MCH9709912.1 hypothetical protein [Actinomycetes bacterium]